MRAAMVYPMLAQRSLGEMSAMPRITCRQGHPAPSLVIRVDGRSPGSRVCTPRQPSRIAPVATIGGAFTDHSCGGSPGLQGKALVPDSRLISLRRTINAAKSSGTGSSKSSIDLLHIVCYP